MRAQLALEYLVIVSFSLMVLIPIILFLYDYSKFKKEEYSLFVASKAVERIGEVIDYICLQGEPAKLTLKLTIPPGLEEIKIVNKTIIFRAKTYSGITDIYYNSICNISGYIPKKEGEYSIIIQAKNKGVYIDVSPS